ncbi:MAG: Ig-like domain-containing protein [Gemmatimonadota bacterium]|nr:Ig-like domain-containing protein [Gemmatimonadota bacterium]
MLLARRPLALLALLALAACGRDDLTLPNEGQPASVAVVSGNGQTGTILEAARDPLVVEVTDRFGNPVVGAEVVWSADGGGDVSPASTLTNADGRAATQRVLGAQPGSYGTTAVATALPEDVASFTTTAVAARLVLVTQPGATASSGVIMDPQPVLQLQDPDGNPLARAGVAVTVQIASGDGALQGTTSQTSDAGGAVAFSDLAIVGAPGARTLIFAASGYATATSTPVSIGVGAPAAVAVSAGDGESARVGTRVSTAPAVVVLDAGGTPLAGVNVVFAVATGGGSVTDPEAVTGADGIAAVGSWRLGGTAGSNTLTATVEVDGVSGNPVTFTATGTPGAASEDESSVSAAPGTIAVSTGSSTSSITIVARDGRGNPLAGQTVTLTATGSGATLTEPGATDGAGTTTALFSSTGSGNHVITAMISGVTLGSATVTVTAGPAVSGQTTVDVPGGTAGAATPIQLRLKDGFGNPVSGASGQIAVAVAGPNTAAAVSVSDNGGGAYIARYTPTIVGTDQIEVRVGGQAVPGSPFTSGVVAGPASPARTTASVPSLGLFANELEILVFVADAQGNPLGRGGDQVVVTVENVADLEVEDLGNGAYRARWRPFIIGGVRVFILLNGTQIAGSPFNLEIRFF